MTKYVTVIGLGRTGAAVARRLRDLGERVLITEVLEAGKIDSTLLAEMEALGIDLELGEHSTRWVKESKLIVVSPGVHLDIPALVEAKKLEVPIISEIELAFQLLHKPLIAVTGTNGKTTTTTLIGEIFKNAGKRVAVAGNIGYPLISVDDFKLDLIVAEISSYQLESVVTFKPWISIILNITEDHLERHRTMEEYESLKGRIFLNQDREDFFIYNTDDSRVAELARLARTKLIPFSQRKILKEGVCVKNGKIISLMAGKEFSICKANEIRIKGEHNLENSLAAIAAAFLCGVSPKVISKTLREFRGVEHRIEYVAEIDGVIFINDSKGTNPRATITALKTFRQQNTRIILIAGGKDKGGDLEEFLGVVKDSVKEVVLIGEATERFREALGLSGFFNIHCAGSISEAVNKAFKLASSGDILLLSPACASFDMFKNFEERGQAFKQAVRNLG